MVAKGKTVDYSWTITLKSKLRSKTPEEQFDYLKTVFSLFPNVELTIIAECHKDYTVHLHGIVSIHLDHILSKYHYEPRRYLFDWFRKSDQIGFMKIDQITDFEYWKSYMLKNIRETYMILGRYPVIRDDYNLLPLGLFEELFKL